MSNVLKADNRESVLAHGRLKWSTRQIAEATGVNRETVTRYLRSAGIPIRLKGFRANPATHLESKPAMQAETAGWPPMRARRHTSKADAHREAIDGWLRDGRTAKSTLQDLVERFGASWALPKSQQPAGTPTRAGRV